MSSWNYRSGGYIVDGTRILTAGAARTEGLAYLEGSVGAGWAGIAETDAASGAKYVLQVKGRFEYPITGAETWSIGTLLYISSANVVTTTSTSNRPFARVVDVPSTATASRPINDIPTGSVWLELIQPTA